MAEKTIHIISHTHWDREWYLNSRYVNQWLIPFFDALFKKMEEQNEYLFALDGQTLIIEDLLKEAEANGRSPDDYKKKIRKYAGEGRLFIGPYYMQTDWQLAGEEALVRNLLYGKKIAAQCGGAMKSGWLLDNFGQVSQAPQIHRGFFIEGLFVWRGIGMDPGETAAEFEWVSPDGSAVTAVYLLAGYRNAMRLADFPETLQERIFFEASKLIPFNKTNHILLMNGYDQEMDPDDILPHIRRIKKEGWHILQSSPEKYLEALHSERPILDRLHGQLYSGRYVSVFPGILSSRMYLKQQNAALQQMLSGFLEPLAVIASLLGASYPKERIEEIWKLILQNQPHDSISGVSIDDVHTDMQERSGLALSKLEDELQNILRGITVRINTAGEAGAEEAYIAYNTLAFERDMSFFIPVQKEKTFIANGGETLESAAITGGYRVLLPRIPALGYRTFYTLPLASHKMETQKIPGDDLIKNFILENNFIRVEIQEDGSINVFDKINCLWYKNLLVFEDGADTGDEYNYSPLPGEEPFYSTGCKAAVSWIENNHLCQICRIETVLRLPAALAGDRKSRSARMRELLVVTCVTVEKNSPVVTFQTTLRNTCKDHRFCVLFPTDIKASQSYSRTQFDVTPHPINPQPYSGEIPPEVKRVINGAYEPEPAEAFPQLSFTCIEDKQRGAAVLNQGLPEYRVIPGRNTIALTLFRSVGAIARGDLQSRVGDAGPAIAAPGAQCLRDMTFDYGFYPYKETWAAAGLNVYADGFNSPMPLWHTGIHGGVLPPGKSFFSLHDPEKAGTAFCLKRPEEGEGVILRFCNNSSAPAPVELSTGFAILDAELAALDESALLPLQPVSARRLKLTLEAKKILTLRLKLEESRIWPYREGLWAEPVKEGKRPADFSSYYVESSITWDDVEQEDRRAAGLEEAYALEPPGEATDAGDRLRREALHRESLEARLSAMLLRKNWFLANCTDDSLLCRELEDYDRKIRPLGLELNRSRIAKRAQEYILDFYRFSSN